MMTKDEPRIRELIIKLKFSWLRVVKDGEQLGIMPVEQARQIAQDNDVDLVEVAPNERPPVCAILDYGKYKYQQKIKQKKQNTKTVEVKELRLRPRIGDHDIETKVNAAKLFLSQGKKVQFNLMYKSRELAHKDEGFKVMNKILEDLKDCSTAVVKPKLDGNRLICKLEPKTP